MHPTLPTTDVPRHVVPTGEALLESVGGCWQTGEMPATTIPIYLELGKTKVFASAIEWPGWCRWAKTPEQAIDKLAEYAARYRPVTELAGVKFPVRLGEFVVIERVVGSATTEFGAPDRPTTSDADPVTSAVGTKQAALVEASWRLLDQVVSSAPAELRKGPRGGGRDRDAIYQHVVAAEAAYARKLGLPHKTPKPGEVDAVDGMRADLLRALAAASGSGVSGSAAASSGASGTPTGAGWSTAYAARRIGWHVLDHAWEIEDKSD